MHKHPEIIKHQRAGASEPQTSPESLTKLNKSQPLDTTELSTEASTDRWIETAAQKHQHLLSAWRRALNHHLVLLQLPSSNRN